MEHISVLRPNFANFGSKSSIPINIFIISMFDLIWVPNFIKIRNIAILRPNLPEVFNFGSRFAISNIIFMINKLYLLCVPTFIALERYFIFGTKFSFNERTDTYFNIECVLLGCNFDFLGGYLVIPARYQVVTGGYCSFLFLVWTEMRSITGNKLVSLHELTKQNTTQTGCSFCDIAKKSA